MDNYNTAAGPFMLLVEGAELPLRYDRRVEVLEAITGEFDELLTQEFGTSPDRVMGRTGHRYATIPAVCPNCGTGLGFSTPLLDTANGALAVATCRGSCGWTGSAVYRLIDLIGDQEKPVGSVVAGGDLQPAYQPY